MRKLFYALLCLYAPSALLGSAENPKIVVIGAGFAGLTAAYRLQQKGMDVEVYEARHRVGGRVFSVNVLGEIGELGAQNIRDGGKAENLLALVDELHLETERMMIPFQLFYGNERETFDFHALLQERHFEAEALKRELQEKATKARTMQELLLALFKPDEVLYKVCSAILSGWEGACPSKLSPQCVSTLYRTLLGGLSDAHPNTEKREIERLSIRGGNGLLAERLAQALRVHLDEQLTQIDKNGEGAYLLTFKSGKQVVAERLILTLPCPVYKDVRIDEAVIPKERLETIRALPCGTTAKILVSVDAPVQGKGGFLSDQANVNIFNTCGGSILTLYCREAHSSFTDATLNERLQESLPLVDAFYTRKSAKAPVMAKDASFAFYEGAVGHSWPNDPFAQGSYSYIPAGHEEAFTSLIEIEGESVKALFAPIDGSLFFAGEHACSDLDLYGTMEAAVQSGERTARLLLKTLEYLQNPL